MRLISVLYLSPIAVSWCVPSVPSLTHIYIYDVPRGRVGGGSRRSQVLVSDLGGRGVQASHRATTHGIIIVIIVIIISSSM